MAFEQLDIQRARSEWRAIIRLGLPLIAAQVAMMGVNVVDTVLSGHVNAHVQAAVATGASIWTLAILTCTGVMLAVPAMVAQLDGAGRRPEAGSVFHQALWIAIVLGLGVGLLVHFAEPLLGVIGVVPELQREVGKFLRAISWGAPALAGYFAMRGLSEGLSMPLPSMFFGWLGLFILAPLDWILMYGKFGVPPLGAQGAGIATAVVLWIEFVGFFIYVLKHRNYRGLHLLERIEPPHWGIISEMLKLGVPMAITILMEGTLFVFATLLIATIGEVETAAHQIALNVVSLAFMVPLGLSMAITVRVARGAGRKDGAAVRYAGYCGISLILVVQAISSGLMLGVPHVIAMLYSNDVHVLGLAAQLIVIAGIFQFSDGIQIASNSALRGLKDTRVPMLLAVFSYWMVGMPVGWVLTFHAGLGVYGMWVGLIAGLSCAAILLFLRFRRAAKHETWRHIVPRTPGKDAAMNVIEVKDT